jgi:two-component system response regulator SaeR
MGICIEEVRYVKMPQREESTDRMHAQTGRAAPAVLVVDDQPQLLGLAVCILRQAGIDALEAHDGREALDVFRRCAGKIGLVITDVEMPQMTGLELAAHLRLESDRPAIVLMSGSSKYQDAIHGSEFLPKPFTSGDLINCVRRHLQSAF